MRNLDSALILFFLFLSGGFLGCFYEYPLRNSTSTDTAIETQSDTGSASGTLSDTGSDTGSSGETVSDTQTIDDDTDSKTETTSDTVPSGPIAILIGSESSGIHDTWNNPSNWDVGVVPSGNSAVVISGGVQGFVDVEGTPWYSGGLWLEAGARLVVGFNVAYPTNANALGTGPIAMREGSAIVARAGLGDYDFAQGITLEGNASIHGGDSSINHRTTKTFSGGIRGAGRLTYKGVTGTWFRFNTPNPLWTGGFQTEDPQVESHAVEAQANGCFGTGDVFINNNCTLVIAAGLTDTIDDSAILSLSGAKAEDLAGKLILNSSETVGILVLDGVPMPVGDYTNAESWLKGPGTLTVLTTP